MKQKQLPLFEDPENDITHVDALLAAIDSASPRKLLEILTDKGITSPKEERRRWDEAYGYTEEGGLYHWITFKEFIDQERPYYRDIVIRVRDGKAEHYQNAKEEISWEGRENLRILIDQLRSRLRKTTND